MSKLENVFLDLDNTIISSEPLKTFNPKDFKEIQDLTFHNMDNYYVVFERPHLQEFLDFLFENFNVSVWTAASKDYALFIINNVILTKPDRKLNLVLFDYHCRWSTNDNNGLKGLKMIWDEIGIEGYTKENSIIIDDLSEIKKIQPDNAITIKDFEIDRKGSENDKELLVIMNELRKKM